MVKSEGSLLTGSPAPAYLHSLAAVPAPIGAYRKGRPMCMPSWRSHRRPGFGSGFTL